MDQSDMAYTISKITHPVNLFDYSLDHQLTLLQNERKLEDSFPLLLTKILDTIFNIVFVRQSIISVVGGYARYVHNYIGDIDIWLLTSNEKPIIPVLISIIKKDILFDQRFYVTSKLHYGYNKLVLFHRPNNYCINKILDIHETIHVYNNPYDLLKELTKSFSYRGNAILPTKGTPFTCKQNSINYFSPN